MCIDEKPCLPDEFAISAPIDCLKSFIKSEVMIHFIDKIKHLVVAFRCHNCIIVNDL